jgi:hypothetical protein
MASRCSCARPPSASMTAGGFMAIRYYEYSRIVKLISQVRRSRAAALYLNAAWAISRDAAPIAFWDTSGYIRWNAGPAVSPQRSASQSYLGGQFVVIVRTGLDKKMTDGQRTIRRALSAMLHVVPPASGRAPPSGDYGHGCCRCLYVHLKTVELLSYQGWLAGPTVNSLIVVSSG